MNTLAGERRVLVTLAGAARTVKDGSTLLCVHYGDPADLHTILLDGAARGVKVEDVPMVRTWTAGDVIAGDSSAYMRDRDGLWRSSRRDFPTLTDADVSANVDMGPDGYDVLRYQAGD